MRTWDRIVEWAARSKLALGAVAIPAALVLAYLGCVALAALQRGYSWREMDWDNSGSTSISEFFGAADTGKRELVVGARGCAEYFAYKDGLPVKTTCDGAKPAAGGARHGEGE